MEIERINSYTDCRFSQVALLQHGCFLVDCYPYEVEIVSSNAAIIKGKNIDAFTKVIDEFRIYAPHISEFYGKDGNLVKEFELTDVLRINLSQNQPSQFYVDREKIAAISSFIQKPEDITIPVLPYKDRYISLDGHTRLYYAVMMGWDTIYAVKENSDALVYKFVDEAICRRICTPMDMIPVSHEEYKIKWNKFCEELFAENE